MQQGSTVWLARGNYSSWEHRRHYVEFSHLLQSNEAFFVAWVSVSPDMPQCLKCLMTAAGIFQLNSFFTSIMLMPYVMVMVDQPVSDCFCILQTCLLPQQLRHLCRGLITLGTTPSPDRTQLEGEGLFKKSWSHFSSRWHHSKMAKLKAHLGSGSIIRGDAKYASLSQAETSTGSEFLSLLRISEFFRFI